MAETTINVHERLTALMARREQRNPGLAGTSVRKPRPNNWKNLINDTTKKDVMRYLFKGIKSR